MRLRRANNRCRGKVEPLQERSNPVAPGEQEAGPGSLRARLDVGKAGRYADLDEEGTTTGEVTAMASRPSERAG